ncbi:MAG TPA: hypothetical protein VFA39_21870 [Steroidobacteraceae bacterium]|nr:hypothetical protein [Steroidobacteraceae bacterium]
MSWLDEVGGLLQKYSGASTSAPPPGAAADFTKVADSAPTSAVSGGLAAAFRSSNTPPFGEMVSQLFAQSDPTQRAGILQHLIAAAGPALASGGALKELTALFPGASAATITPQQAEQIPPTTVRQLADVAQQHDPSIIDRASEFYAQHPTLVKTLGAGALALIMSHLSQRH